MVPCKTRPRADPPNMRSAQLLISCLLSATPGVPYSNAQLIPRRVRYEKLALYYQPECEYGLLRRATATAADVIVYAS